MLDRDLAELYGVETRGLNQAVQRNTKRFPDDFMFVLSRGEIMRISQIVTSSKLKYSRRVCAFTSRAGFKELNCYRIPIINPRFLSHQLGFTSRYRPTTGCT
jgi:hypothetical protein